VSTVPPIRREILVDADPATAFEAFTAHIGRWWPLAELSVYGTGASVEFSVARSSSARPAAKAPSGNCHPMGACSGGGIHLHPAGRRNGPATLRSPSPRGSQTLVTLMHAGWDAFADPAAARAEYEQGWPMVLGRYRDHADQRGRRDGGDTWVALLHARALPRHQARHCSTTRGSLSTVAFLTACAKPGISSPPDRWPTPPVRAWRYCGCPAPARSSRHPPRDPGRRQCRRRILHGHRAPVAGHDAVPPPGN